MEEERLKAILESLLFAAGEPVSLAQLASVIDSVPREAIRRALAEMALAYASGGRGVVLEQIAGGYQLRTAGENAPYVRKMLAARPPRLSRPMLEALAIIAYRQPITRPEIEQLRGVDSGGVLDTLLERRLVRVAGRKEAPGRPLLYATTAEFLEVFALRDLASLPDLEELKQVQSVDENSSGGPPEDAGAPSDASGAPDPSHAEEQDSALAATTGAPEKEQEQEDSDFGAEVGVSSAGAVSAPAEETPPLSSPASGVCQEAQAAQTPDAESEPTPQSANPAPTGDADSD